jgi:flagellar protein FlgJ
MAAPLTDTQALALDAQGLERLKQQAGKDPGRAVGEASKQFEALLLNMMLKSMRQAGGQEGMFDTEQSKLYTSMFDQQIAQHLAKRGIGIADVMTRQLTKNAPAATPADAAGGAKPADGAPAGGPAALQPFEARGAANRIWLRAMEAGRTSAPEAPAAPAGTSAPSASPLPVTKTREFVDRIWSHAVDAARATGIKPQFMVGQAALESGWGRNEIRGEDGARTYNLFGVKAGKSWTGPVVEKTTTEYVNGVAQKTTAKFRVYSSYAESFKDYASLLTGNRRYAEVIGHGQTVEGFARGLQQAGYATDPAYADKLTRIINGPTLRASLLG